MLDEDFRIELEGHINLLKKCEFIRSEQDVKKLCEKAKEILTEEGNVLYLNAPITVLNFKPDMWRYTWTVS